MNKAINDLQDLLETIKFVSNNPSATVDLDEITRKCENIDKHLQVLDLLNNKQVDINDIIETNDYDAYCDRLWEYYKRNTLPNVQHLSKLELDGFREEWIASFVLSEDEYNLVKRVI